MIRTMDTKWKSQLDYDRRHVWHPYASIGNPPPVNFASSASGVEIELADGSRLVDAVSSWWCVAHGHNHPAIVEAIADLASAPPGPPPADGDFHE